MEDGQKNFDSVSKVLKREVKRFEVSMKTNSVQHSER